MDKINKRDTGEAGERATTTSGMSCSRVQVIGQCFKLEMKQIIFISEPLSVYPSFIKAEKNHTEWLITFMMVNPQSVH